MPRKSATVLTDAFVRVIRPGEGRLSFMDATAKGLELRLGVDGAKTWNLRYRAADGATRRFKLGSYPAMPVHGARTAAYEAASRIAAGQDPQAERIRERRTPKERLKPVTVGDLWATYVEQVLPQRKPRTAEYNQWLWATHVAPALAYTALADLDRTSVAEQGDPDAQARLGDLYRKGEGTPENYTEAVRWYRLAAAQGYLLAQVNLGTMYALGEGAPENYVEAYKWWALAAARGDAKAKQKRDIVRDKMTPAQIAEAQKLAAEWKPRPSVAQ